jgi:hypothetical protein
VLEEAADAAGKREDAMAAWGEEVEALVTLLERAMEVALRVIGTAEEGLPESLLFEKEGGDEYRGETPVQTAGPGFGVRTAEERMRTRRMRKGPAMGMRTTTITGS